MRSVVLWAALATGCGVALAAELPSVDEVLSTGISNRTDGALVIGIEEYPFLPAGGKQVPFARRDAQAFHDWLVYTRGLSPSRVKKLTEAPTREDVRDAARSLGRQVGADGTLWVYFAGHGAARPLDGARALLPADAKATDSSLNESTVTLDELYGWLGETGAQIVSVVDACYAGAGRDGGLITPSGSRLAVSLDGRTPARVVEWVATEPSQIAQPLTGAQHGAFTYAVLGALRGWADGLRGERDGQVTLEEADLYVRRALPTLGFDRQVPMLKAEPSALGTVLVSSSKLQRAPEDSALRAAVGRVPSTPVVQPTVVSPTVSGSGGFAMVELDVSAALARQEAETEAQRQADAAQSGRLAAEVSRLQGEARTAWSKLGPQLEACAKLADAAQRAPCVAQAERFVAWSKGLVAEVSAGTETVTTKVGPLVRAVSARKETVVVPELAAAEAALAKVKAGPSAVVAPVAGGAAGSCGSWSGGQGCTVARIPKGTFTMGSPTTESGRGSDEAQVSVTLTRDFLLMTTEVTQGLYQAVTGKNPSQSGQMFWDGKDQGACDSYEGVSLVDPRYPVHCVSWLDAVSFANALSVKDGLTPVYSISGTTVTPSWGANGWRLPTEAEWERAARGGGTAVYAGTSELGSVCRYGNVADASAKARWSGWTTFGCDDGVAGLARVGSYTANAYGLHDMTGNVWEWVWDWYGSSLPGGTDPAGAASGSDRVGRGGSWGDDASHARVAGRYHGSPGDRDYSLGFRLLRPVP